MKGFIVKNSTTAADRRVGPILIYAGDGLTPWSGSVTGVKAQLSFNGGSESASANDIVRVAGASHYVELTQGESNTALGGVQARVAAATGQLEGVGFAMVLTDDPTAAAPTAASVASAVLDEALSGHTTAGTLGKAVADIEVDATAILADTGTDGVVLAANSVNASALATDAVTEIVNALLATTISGVSVSNLLSAAGGLNFSISGTTLTVRNLAGDVIYTRALTLAERNAINVSAVP